MLNVAPDADNAPLDAVLAKLLEPATLNVDVPVAPLICSLSLPASRKRNALLALDSTPIV